MNSNTFQNLETKTVANLPNGIDGTCKHNYVQLQISHRKDVNKYFWLMQQTLILKFKNIFMIPTGRFLDYK